MLENQPLLFLFSAFFSDFLSIKSLKKRYVGSSNSDNGVFCQWNHNLNDDFETFVQEFPIDDNISECFASSSDDTIKDLEGIVSEVSFNGFIYYHLKGL